MASGAGFVLIGALDSLIDSPRLLLLFLLVMWLCWRSASLLKPGGNLLLRKKDSKLGKSVDGGRSGPDLGFS